MTNFWCVVTLAACIGVYFGMRVVATARERGEVVSETSAEITRRAYQQNRWAQRGDVRGVYGVEGADPIRRVDPEPSIETE
jgi:hypothetical protein